MNAIKNSVPVKNQDAINISNEICNYISNEFNIKTCCLGSTGKKKDDQYSGDIDLCIEFPYNDNNINKIITYLKTIYTDDIQISILKGLNIISFGYNNNNKIHQVDLMFTDNIEYAKFIYHSPNYKNNESQFKGLYRTNLLAIIASNIPNNNKNNTDINYWKYTLSYINGFIEKHKTYQGKKGLLKNPVDIKEDTKYITKDVNKIIKYILGDSATINDTNSFETLIDYIISDKYPYNNLVDIIHEFMTDKRHKEKLNELSVYIINTLKKYNKYNLFMKKYIFKYLVFPY